MIAVALEASDDGGEGMADEVGIEADEQAAHERLRAAR